MKLRTLIFWPHLVAGLLAGVVVLLMSVTGVLLTYERQMVAWADSQYRSAPAGPGAVRVPLARLAAAVAQAAPGASITTMTLTAEADAPVAVSTGDGTLYFDAYSGAFLGKGSTGLRAFMSEVRAWHRWLAVDGEGRTVARAITGWSNLLFAFLVVTGAYLWLPRTWRWSQLKAVLFFRRHTSAKARDFNWHNVIGVWSVVPLFIVVISAVPISFPWANAAIYRAVGEAPPAGRGGGTAGRGGDGARAEGPRGARPESNRREGGPAAGERQAPRAGGAERERGDSPAIADDIDALVTRAQRQVPDWYTLGLRVPDSATAAVVFNIDRSSGGRPQYRSTLTLARAGAEVVSFEDFSSLTPGRRIRNVMRFAHTGEVLGVPGQTIAGLVSAGGAVLVWTGFALAWRRFRAWLGRRSTRARTVDAPDRTSAVA